MLAGDFFAGIAGHSGEGRIHMLDAAKVSVMTMLSAICSTAANRLACSTMLSGTWALVLFIGIPGDFLGSPGFAGPRPLKDGSGAGGLRRKSCARYAAARKTGTARTNFCFVLATIRACTFAFHRC